MILFITQYYFTENKKCLLKLFVHNQDIKIQIFIQFLYYINYSFINNSEQNNLYYQHTYTHIHIPNLKISLKPVFKLQLNTRYIIKMVQLK